MLSTETPSDASCSSSKLWAVKADERPPAKLAFQEADPKDIPAPSFCIRDYVFASRGKDIAATWPFKQRSLRLYLKHGIKDLLPPFECHSFVKSHCLARLADTKKSASSCQESGGIFICHVDLLEHGDTSPSHEKYADFGSKPCFPLEEIFLDSSNPGLLPSAEERRKSTVVQGNSLDEATPSLLSELEDTEPIYKPAKLSRPLEKKRKLIVKLGVPSDVSQTEDIVSNSSSFSDSMASKVCPVCKTFSSPSNTTLNAHIDQCLSMEFDNKKIMDKSPKIKVKPRKKKLMVDIYTTAPRCTLEDLDRRNGTNWAIELTSTVAPSSEVLPDSKRPKLSSVKSSNDPNNVAIYVDTSGKKLRILSKFIETPSQNDELKLTKQAKDWTANKNILVRKKKDFAPKYSNLKMKAHNRRLCSFKQLRPQIWDTERGGDCQEEAHQKNYQSPSQISNEESYVPVGKSLTVRQRLYSKHPDIVQNLITEDTHVKKKLPATASILTKNSLQDLYKSSSEDTRPRMFSRLSKGYAGSMKAKRVNTLCRSEHSIADGKKMSLEPSPVSSSKWSAESYMGNRLLLKLSRSSKNLLCSSKSKLDFVKDIHPMNDDTSDITARPLESCPSLVKAQRNLSTNNNQMALRKSHWNLVGKEVEGSGIPSISKRFCKYRSNLRSVGRGVEVRASFDGGASSRAENVDLDITANDKEQGSNDPALAKGLKRPGSGEIISQFSPSTRDVHSNAAEHEDDKLNQLPPDNLSEAASIESLDMPTETSNCRYYATGPSVEQAVSDHHVSNTSVNEEELQTASDTQLDPHSCTEEQLKQKSLDPDEYVDVSCNKVPNEDNQMTNKTEIGGANVSCLNRLAEYHAGTTSVQESDGCLTNQGDSRLERPQQTSVGPANENTEISGSPVSVASAVSLLSPEGTKFMNANAEHSGYFLAQQDDAVPCKEITGAIEGRNFGGRYHEVEGKPLAQEPEQISGANPFCYSCSFKERLSRESQLSRQNTDAGIAKEIHVSNLFIGPGVSSPFSAYQNRRMETKFELPRHTGPFNNSHDVAAKYPTCTDLNSPSSSSQCQNPSTRNPVLRLMGKNLTVVNNDEIIEPQTNASEYSHNVNMLSTGIASTNNLLQSDNLPYLHRKASGESPSSHAQAISIGSHQMPLQLQVEPVSGFLPYPNYHNGWVTKLDQDSQQKRPYKRLSSLNASYTPNEVIVIDDSPEREAELKSCLVSPTSTLPLTASNFNYVPQLPVTSFQSSDQIHEFTGRSERPLFPNYYPGINAGLLHQGSIAEGQGPSLPMHFIFQSPITGQVRPSMHFSPTLH